jgi:DNA-binding beta-propeller fold protein YncE
MAAREPLAMRVMLAILGGALGLGLCGAPVGASASATPSLVSTTVAGCSTTVAAAPDLSKVGITYLSGPIVPFGVAMSTNSKFAFVADSAGALFVYRLSSSPPTLEKADLFYSPGGHSYQAVLPALDLSPIGLAITPNSRYLVAAEGSGAAVFDVANLEKSHSRPSSWLVGKFRTNGEGAIEAAVAPSGAYVFVTMEDSNELAVLRLASALREGFRRADLVGMVPLGVAPVGMAIAPNGHYLYVTSEANSSTGTEGTLTTINLAEAERAPSHAIISTVPAGCSPVRVVATSKSVFVTARGSDALLEFNATDLVDHPASAFESDVLVGEAPVGLALVNHDRTIVISDSDRFATPGAGADLAIVSVHTNGQMLLDGYIGSGSFPRDMAASPNGKWLLVSNYGSSQVEAIDLSLLP